MKELTLKNVTYKKSGWFGNLLQNMAISRKKFFNRETVDLYVRVKSGTSFSAPVKDLLYKAKDGNFKSIKTKLIINDELDNNYIGVDLYGNPYTEGVFNNGTGNFKFIKLNDRCKFETLDIRANDVFEATAFKLMKLLEPDKFQKGLVMMFALGMISLGIFFVLGLTGLGTVINKGIESVMTEMTSQMGNIPIAGAP